MNYSAGSFRAIGGVVLSTTHQYHRHMTFSKIAELLAKASDKGITDSEGVTHYQYTAHSRHTNPYRTLRGKIHNTPGQWLEIHDFPAGGHTGLVEVKYANPYLNYSGDNEELHYNKELGVWFSSSKPRGW
ncbi:MAG: hypothetical protein GC179_08755 [Anaerolineaceae bacterium]|nr:hypothetical protein [Anaerolineaceae bacterium]